MTKQHLKTKQFSCTQTNKKLHTIKKEEIDLKQIPSFIEKSNSTMDGI